MLANSSQWFGDGTFKLCPQIFSQIYTIRALVNHKVLLCVFALLPSTTEIVYKLFFTTIFNAVRNNKGNVPHGFLVGFETAAINAILNVLPQTDISGYFFYLSSNLWRHIQRAGVQERCMNDPQSGLQLRMITDLALVPPQDVVNSLDELCIVIRNQYHGDADEALDYTEDTYFGSFRRNVPRRPPLFPIELRDMFNRIVEELPPTAISRLGIILSMLHLLIYCSKSF